MRGRKQNYILKRIYGGRNRCGGDRAGADPGYPYRIGHCIQGNRSIPLLENIFKADQYKNQRSLLTEECFRIEIPIKGRSDSLSCNDPGNALMTLLLVMAESARTAGERLYLRMAVDSSMDSLMSQYHRKPVAEVSHPGAGGGQQRHLLEEELKAFRTIYAGQKTGIL